MNGNRVNVVHELEKVNLFFREVGDNQLQMYTVEKGQVLPLDRIFNDDGYLAMYGLGWTRRCQAVVRLKEEK